MSPKIFLNTLLLLWGLGLTANAQAQTYCVFYNAFEPLAQGNAAKVAVNESGQLEVLTSKENTLTNFSISMYSFGFMVSTYRGGDSCFLSYMAPGWSYSSGNLRFTTQSVSTAGCANYIGIPDGRSTYKGGATNFNFPYGGAYVYEIWGPCYATVILTLNVSVINPSQPFPEGGQAFDPRHILLKFSSGQVSRDLNGTYFANMYSPLLVKSPPLTPAPKPTPTQCSVVLSSKTRK